VFVALFARIFMGARLGPAKGALLMAAYAGCAIIALSGGGGVAGQNLSLGLAASLASAALYAAYQLIIQKISSRQSSMAVASAVSYWSVIPAVVFWGFTPIAAPPLVFIVALAMGFFSTFLPMVLLVAAISRIGAAETAMTSFVGPIVSVVAANLLFGELLSHGQILGGALVLISVTLLFFVDRR
ncbi:DMT family transporter, partial [bacterium]